MMAAIITANIIMSACETVIDLAQILAAAMAIYVLLQMIWQSKNKKEVL